MVLNHGRHLPEPIYYNLILTQLNDLFNVQKRVLSLARFKAHRKPNYVEHFPLKNKKKVDRERMIFLFLIFFRFHFTRKSIVLQILWKSMFISMRQRTIFLHSRARDRITLHQGENFATPNQRTLKLWKMNSSVSVFHGKMKSLWKQNAAKNDHAQTCPKDTACQQTHWFSLKMERKVNPVMYSSVWLLGFPMDRKVELQFSLEGGFIQGP